jgi:hypothetical protein
MTKINFLEATNNHQHWPPGKAAAALPLSHAQQR